MTRPAYPRESISSRGVAVIDRHLVKVELSKPLPPAVMGFRVWIIVDSHGNAVTRDGFSFWADEREAVR